MQREATRLSDLHTSELHMTLTNPLRVQLVTFGRIANPEGSFLVLFFINAQQNCVT